MGERFARGLFPEVTQGRLQPHSRPDMDEFEWIVMPPLGTFTGAVFTDGSATPGEEALRKAGWAIVMLADDGTVLGAACGTVPLAWAPLQQARDGEDYAVHMLSGRAAAPLEVHIDCQGTVDCARSKGKALAMSNARRHMWRRWWAEMDGGEVAVVKVKAHRTAGECTSLREEWTRRGNELADTYAKRGAAKWRARDERA